MDEQETIEAEEAAAPLTVAESISDKEEERNRLQKEIEEFLASGGKINQIPVNVVADPPKKPESNYGGQPI